MPCARRAGMRLLRLIEKQISIVALSSTLPSLIKRIESPAVTFRNCDTFATKMVEEPCFEAARDSALIGQQAYETYLHLVMR